MQKFAGRSQRWFDLVFAPVFFLGLFLLHPVLGWIGIACLGGTLALAALREYISREPRRAARTSAAKKADLLATIQANRDAVSAHSMASIVAERWKRVAHRSAEAQSRLESRSVSLDTLITGLGRLVRIGMIAAGAWLFLRDELTIGGMFAARVLAGMGFGLVEHAVKEWGILRDARLGYRRTKARLAKLETPEASVSGDVHQQAIVLDLVTFRHNGQRGDLFKRISMTLEPGELLAVTGPAASGKTTLSRLLVGLLEPRHGQIRMGDVEITRLPEEIKTRCIGYMPQYSQLLRATVRENIARFDEGPLEKVIDAARLVEIHDRIVQLPEGYDTVIGPDYEGLSGSELKRIAIARALYGSPRLVVLDEAAANLDKESRRAMEAAVNNLRGNGSSIVITQSIRSPRINAQADKFLDLGEGRGDEPAAKAEQAVRRAKISAV